jgi:hypothetical protein
MFTGVGADNHKMNAELSKDKDMRLQVHISLSSLLFSCLQWQGFD